MLDSDSNDGPALADPLETDIESESCSFKDLNSVNLFCEYFRLLHSVITSSRLLISVRCRDSNNLVFLTNYFPHLIEFYIAGFDLCLKQVLIVKKSLERIKRNRKVSLIP